MPNASISHSFGGPNQAWDVSCWTHTEMGQPASQISQDLQRHLISFSSVPLCQNDTQEYSQLLDTTFQQTRSNLASWEQPFQNTMPSSRQGHPILSHNTHGGATYVAPAAPRPSMIDATSVSLAYEQQLPSIPTHSRLTPATSNSRSAFSFKVSEVSSTVSSNPETLTAYGFRSSNNNWSCAWPGCTSRARFTRACDLRKHYNRHSKTLFCRYKGCPQSREAGFSNKKDRARHETKHNPKVTCNWEGCGRLFGRVDNMVGRRQQQLPQRLLLTLLNCLEGPRTKGAQQRAVTGLASHIVCTNLSVAAVH